MAKKGSIGTSMVIHRLKKSEGRWCSEAEFKIKHKKKLSLKKAKALYKQKLNSG
jgi:hypothetical protein